ncbi:MAG: putative oxidoreductase [Gemmatimonadetes bacterium]|jgi:protein-disulfide isomerase|nr:putative oxidoreductase [Gemmatimonadota bacterium]
MLSRTFLLAVLGAALACDNSTPQPPPKSVRDMVVERSRASTRLDSFSLAADRGRVLGDSAAPVWVVVVSDYQCAQCKRWNDDVLPILKSDYVTTGRIRLAVLNMPQAAHLNAVPTALAATCASAQGKFWETSAKIFETQSNWKDLPDARPYLDSLAIAAGADAPTLRACTENARGLKLINSDVERNKAAGVDSVPTFFIGARKVVGAQSVAAFRAAIESAVAEKK